MAETWKAVVGWEGQYEVSDQGRVRSLDRKHHPGTVLKPLDRGRGKHLHVTLSHQGRKRNYLIHRLVAEAFIPNPEGYPWVLHWDDTPQNNQVENLRWGVPAENTIDSVRNGSHYNARKTHCPRGHEFTEENTYLRPSGARRCKTCVLAQNRLASASKKG